MAFDENQRDYHFASGIADCFQCVICLSVLEEPMQCVQNEHSFCKRCITRHLRQCQNCPTCKEPLTLQTLRPSRLVVNLLSQLKIPCKYAERGCPEIIKQEMLQTHVRNCGFSPVQCSNAGCELIINRKDQHQHEVNDCNLRKGKCEVCGRNVPREKRKLHCYVRKEELDSMKMKWEYEMACLNGKLQSAVQDFTTQMKDMADRMKVMKLQVDDINRALGELKENTKLDRCHLKNNLGNVNDKVDELFSRVNGVKCYMTAMESKTDDMKVQISDVNADVGHMRKTADTLYRDIQDTKNQFEQVQTTIKHRDQEMQSKICSLRRSVISFGQNINLKKDIIIAGGQNNKQELKSVEIFTWADRTWFSLNHMSLSRSAASSFVHERQMIISGGVGENGSCSNAMECIKLSQRHSSALWSIFPARLPQQYRRHKCLVYDNCVLVIGGRDSLKTCDEIYRVSLNPPYVSQVLCRMPEPRQSHGAELFDDNIIIVGGTSLSRTTLDSVLEYSIKTNKFKPLAPLPIALSLMATVAWKHYVIIIGGKDKNNQEKNEVIMYNITNEKSTMLPSMKHKRSGCTAVISGDAIVVMGGRNKEEGCLDAVELFRFDDYSWQELPPMTEKRWYGTAVVREEE